MHSSKLAIVEREPSQGQREREYKQTKGREGIRGLWDQELGDSGLGLCRVHGFREDIRNPDSVDFGGRVPICRGTVWILSLGFGAWGLGFRVRDS